MLGLCCEMDLPSPSLMADGCAEDVKEIVIIRLHAGNAVPGMVLGK